MKLRFFLLFLIIVLNLSCNVEKEFPNVNLQQYKKNSNELKFADVVGKQSIVILLPMNSCGICIKSVISVLKEKKLNLKGIVVTSHSNALHYNWIKLNEKKIPNSWQIYHVDNHEFQKHKNFFEKYNNACCFLLKENLVFKEVYQLGISEKSIIRTIRHLKVRYEYYE